MGGGEKKQKKSNKLLKGILLLFVLTAAVLAGLIYTASKGGANMDSVLRFFTYLNLEKDDDGQFEMIKFDSHITNLYSRFGDSLAVLSSSDFRVFNNYGKEIFSKQALFKNPAVVTSEKYAAVFDRGERYILVVDRRGNVVLETELEGTIIRVHINDRGYMAVITRQSGYKSIVTVYGPDMREMYRRPVSSKYAVSACVSDDGTMLAIGCVGQEGIRFLSSVDTFMLNSEDRYSEHIIEDSLLLSVSFMEQDSICAVTEDKMLFIKPGAEETDEFSYMGLYLDDYVVRRGWCAPFLNRYRSGGKADMVLVAPDGREAGRITQNDEILDVSASEKYLAVLYPDELYIYTSDFKPYAELAETHGAAGVLMRNDGSAILLYADSASLYIP